MHEAIRAITNWHDNDQENVLTLTKREVCRLLDEISRLEMTQSVHRAEMALIVKALANEQKP
jgi:hypothetical protein